MVADEEAQQTFDKLSRAQLEIYARELRGHVQSERRLRKELEAEQHQLQQRVREITALNQLFQKHLDERLKVIESYREVLGGLKDLVQGAVALEEWARRQPVPDLHGLPGLSPDESE